MPALAPGQSTKNLRASRCYVDNLRLKYRLFQIFPILGRDHRPPPRKDAKASQKEVKIEWLIPESKKRSVTVGGQEAFVQEYQDTEGEFLAPFQHLRL